MPTITSGGLFSTQTRTTPPDFSQLIRSGQQMLLQAHDEIDQMKPSNKLPETTARAASSDDCCSTDEESSEDR
ncbi:hypothetical protein CROQUDRAFT_106801 [Cronartium quercuum f. sp. fusiforme G11]|uniref:Uncharacterized protein n=1 Tax=Cronartium quercuum f. sp. fusiforme G11 TaxID=708437 RepID=A0A9P6TC39_9BASI|nr:hypothetical protein CROQUDRAFT_106801 [Cronartium quercuum f. sp. fusiforme G11]